MAFHRHPGGAGGGVSLRTREGMKEGGRERGVINERGDELERKRGRRERGVGRGGENGRERDN